MKVTYMERSNVWLELGILGKSFLCSEVGFVNHLQNNVVAPTTENKERIANNLKFDTSFAIIATPNIKNSARLAIDNSVVPIKFALLGGIPVWRIWVPMTS